MSKRSLLLGWLAGVLLAPGDALAHSHAWIDPRGLVVLDDGGRVRALDLDCSTISIPLSSPKISSSAASPCRWGAGGVCSCGTFDPTRLMFVAAGLFRDARMDATMIPSETALELATINGAKALLWEDEIGSLEIGKNADIVSST